MIKIDELTNVSKADLDDTVKDMKEDYDFVSVIQESSDNFTLIGGRDVDREITPLWLKIASQELQNGIAEIKGSLANSRIVEYHNATSLKATSDEIPWCSSFVNFCMREANVEGTDSAAALSWKDWGDELDKPSTGCIAVFTRTGGGHVGFYLGSEDNGNILLLGGNQGDRVSIARRTTANLVSFRWLKQQNQAGTTPPVAGEHLGKLSERFESRGKPSAIGLDKTGGFSYGTYQIASRTGTMGEFLSFLKTDAPSFFAKLNSAGGESAAKAGNSTFKAGWIELAADSAFNECQYQFIKQTHYDVQVDKLKRAIGLDVNAQSIALQNVVWSVAVQHRSNTTPLIKNALEGKVISSLDDKSIINAIYDERSKVDKYFEHSTEQVKKSVKNRFVQERKDALLMLV